MKEERKEPAKMRIDIEVTGDFVQARIFAEPQAIADLDAFFDNVDMIVEGVRSLFPATATLPHEPRGETSSTLSFRTNANLESRKVHNAGLCGCGKGRHQEGRARS